MSRSSFVARWAVLSGLSGLAVCLTGLAGLTAAHAAPTQWSTALVVIDFDPDTFSFTSDSIYSGPVEISPDSVSYTQVDQGVVINFQGQLAAFASSYTQFTEDSRTAFFNAFFDFTPQPGYVITGYKVTYSGGYFVEWPGSVGLNGQSGTIVLSSGSGGDNFSIDSDQAGALAPQIAGELTAWAGVDYIEIFEGFEKVYSHDEQVLDYCEQDDPSICYYRTDPVYIDVPIYRYESDLGEAQISLNTITVQAQVAVVPEPATVGMALGGLALVCGWTARRRRMG